MTAWASATSVVVYINRILHSVVDAKNPPTIVYNVQGRDAGLGKLFMPFVFY